MNRLLDPEFLSITRTVRECHDDDTPRLVAADWLQESGFDHWPELIRLQCLVHRENLFLTQDEQGRRIVCPEVRRCEELLPKVADFVIPGCRASYLVGNGLTIDSLPNSYLDVGITPFNVTFERGFLVRARSKLIDFVRRCPEIALIHPLVPHTYMCHDDPGRNYEIVLDGMPHVVFWQRKTKKRRGVPEDVFSRLKGKRLSSNGCVAIYPDRHAAKTDLAVAVLKTIREDD